MIIHEKLRFFEFKAMFGGNLVCGFGRLFGQLTGFLINSGPITAGDSQKGGHFVQVRTLGPGSGCLHSKYDQNIFLIAV